MEASPMSLFEEFIKGARGSQYVIPVYQRNYTWRKNKQVKQLLSDIERILNGETKRHFIGTVVYAIVNTDFIVRERAVVDGQQRLITMFLIAHALKNIADHNGAPHISRDLTTKYLENVNDDKYNFENLNVGKYRYRLQPSVSDDDAYSYIAQGKIDEYEGNSLVMDNYHYIYKNLDELSNKYSLNSVIDAVKGLYIVRIELGKNDDAQQIFESINSTGEKLTAADLIRNYIMMNRTNDEQEKMYANYWLKLERVFPESKKMAEFFRFYLASKTYLLTSEKDLYDSFKGYWASRLESENYLEILEDLWNYAKHFSRLYLANTADELAGVLYDYNKLQSLMPAPFAMQILEHFRKNEITLLQTQEVLKLLNIYLIRRYINGQDTSAISRFFPGFLKNVETQIVTDGGFDNIVDICIYYLVNENKGKAAFMPDDNMLCTYLQTANAYSLSNIRWVLDKIEMHNNPAPVDLSSLNIEHIMPQTQNEYWKQVSKLEEDEYINVVNRLGNLTLAASSDNSKMGNNDFEYKKKVLDSTMHLRLNTKILTKQYWTVQDIEERTRELTNRIIEIFPYAKTSYAVSGKEKSRHIALKSRGVKAEGYLNSNNSLTVYAGSQVRYDTVPSSDTLKELREKLFELEIIEQKGGRVEFIQNYTFGSPSTATDFILGGSNNGWFYWKDKDNLTINESLRNNGE